MIPFAEVNRSCSEGYMPGWVKHHILPAQVALAPQLNDFLMAISPYALLHDFRFNGILLPGNDNVADRTGLALHRGAHAGYNDWVCGELEAERVLWRAGNALSTIVTRGSVRALQMRLRRMLDTPCPESISLSNTVQFVEFAARFTLEAAVAQRVRSLPAIRLIG